METIADSGANTVHEPPSTGAEQPTAAGDTSTGKRRSGRRRGDTTTRQDILDAARNEFADNGFDKATIRGIAGSAGVDPALVHHFFGTKQDLFMASVRLPLDPATAIAHIDPSRIDGIGERVIDFFLTIWDDPDRRTTLLTLIRGAMTHEQSADMLRDLLTQVVLSPLTQSLRVDNPWSRVSAVASHLIGVAMVRYVVRLEPMASAPRERVVATVGPAIQRYFTESIDLSSSQPAASQPASDIDSSSDGTEGKPVTRG